MEAEQRDAIEWSREEALKQGVLGTKQQIRPRSTWFIPASLILGILAIAGIVAAALLTHAPLRGGSAIGLPLGVTAAGFLFAAASLGIRKRMRTTQKQAATPDGKPGGYSLGGMEAWTQFHMVFGAIGFTAAVAHAGFQVTGIFTTLLMVVFALEVTTGVLGQIIYATVPTALTRLERHGLARLVEDLYDEESTLERSIGELVANIAPKLWHSLRARVEAVAGNAHDRMSAAYDPITAVAAGKTKLAEVLREAQVTDVVRTTIERIVESRFRLLDVRAQLLLHRRLKGWLVVHVATACALLVLVTFHIATALTLI
jgi:hypothetical protein